MSRARQHPLDRLRSLTHLNILGLNTGTSLDGLDLCLVRFSEAGGRMAGVEVLQVRSVPFSKRLRESLWNLANASQVDKHDLLRTEMAYTEWIARCLHPLKTHRTKGKTIHALACHGQTIAHFPKQRSRRGNHWRGDTTWQLGSGPLLAQSTGIITVDDFRSSDIAAGGMGAPLSAYYHYLLFGDEHAVLNLGGIANISVVRRRRRRLDILAFDIGPGNMLIDSVAQRALGRPYDRDGQTARRGKPIDAILKRATAHPYFRKRPPKTCGREEFGEAAMTRWFARRTPSTHTAPDWLATAVEITASQIGRAITRWVEPFSPVRSLLLSGGGVKNTALVDAIRSHLPHWTITATATAGIDPQYVEPAGFAALAHETLRGRPGN
ncbi:MAG: hypothetical protein GF341_06250, partial [candidate division Zixibacteria bacterium]|nr:hypothetical protein [candidate division Zixibacteria bacterium]